MTDHYRELGELHDLFMPDVWDPLVGTLATTFGDLGPDTTILDAKKDVYSLTVVRSGEE